MSSDDESRTENSETMDQLLDLINKKDVDSINEMQKKLFNRFEKSNQMLVHCNESSNQHFSKLSKDFRSHSTKLNEMYKDLDSIFHRIRGLKQKLYAKYPHTKPDQNMGHGKEAEEIVESVEKIAFEEEEKNTER